MRHFSVTTIKKPHPSLGHLVTLFNDSGETGSYFLDFPLLLWTDNFTVATVNANKRTDDQQLLYEHDAV